MMKREGFPEIRTDVFVLAREKAGYSKEGLASLACLSVSQIEQIENGKTSSFYGIQNKLTAAKKVAAILGLDERDIFEGQKSTGYDVNDAQELAEIIALDSADEVKGATAQTSDLSSHSDFESKPNVGSGKSTRAWYLKKRVLLAAFLLEVAFAGPIIYGDSLPEAYSATVDVITRLKERAIHEIASLTAKQVASLDGEMQTSSDGESSMNRPESTRVLSVKGGADCPAVELPQANYRSPTLGRDIDVIFIQAKQTQLVCVLDALGQVSAQVLEQDVDTPFYGKPPFQILTSGLDDLSVFYHGALIPKEKLLGKTLLVEPQEVGQTGGFSISTWALKLIRALIY